jgi:hypothetical protein
MGGQVQVLRLLQVCDSAGVVYVNDRFLGMLV